MSERESYRLSCPWGDMTVELAPAASGDTVTIFDEDGNEACALRGELALFVWSKANGAFDLVALMRDSFHRGEEAGREGAKIEMRQFLGAAEANDTSNRVAALEDIVYSLRAASQEAPRCS